MVKALFDTNILIDHLNGVPKAKVEIARYRDRAISILTWMEVMVGATEKTDGGTRAFLDSFILVELNGEIAELAVQLRKAHHLRLPDAIIWASAQSRGAVLVTRNTKDFPAGEAGIHIPYRL